MCTHTTPNYLCVHTHHTPPHHTCGISGWMLKCKHKRLDISCKHKAGCLIPHTTQTHKHLLVAVQQLIHTDAYTDQRDSFKFERFECILWIHSCGRQAAESRTVMVHGGTIVSSESVASCFRLVSAMTCVSWHSVPNATHLGAMCRARDGAAV